MKEAYHGFIAVFSSPKRSITAGLIAVFLYILFIFIPNRVFLLQVLTFSSPILEKVKVFISFLTAPEIAFASVVSFSFTVLGIILFSLFAVSFYYVISVRKQALTLKDSSLTGAGIFSLILGFGCLSCGPILITSIAGASGVAFAQSLPLEGVEFGILACGLIGFSLFSILKKADAPLVC